MGIENLQCKILCMLYTVGHGINYLVFEMLFLSIFCNDQVLSLNNYNAKHFQ